MVTRTFKQMLIRLKYKGTTYKIQAESIKPIFKQDEEEYYATDSYKPYAKAVDKQSYEFQLGGVSPSHYKLFKKIFLNQPTTSGQFFSLTTYGYDKNHKTEKRDGYIGCSITEMSNETADPFDVKFSCMEIS